MKTNKRKPITMKGDPMDPAVNRLMKALFGGVLEQRVQVTLKKRAEGEVTVRTETVPTRPFIDRYYDDYVVVSVNDKDLLNKLIKGDKDLMSTIAIDKVVKDIGKKFHAAFGIIRDSKGTLILLPGDGTFMESLDDMGVSVKYKPGGAGKAMKYVKRLFAPHPLSYDPPTVLVKKPVGKMTDGFGLMSLSYARKLHPKGYLNKYDPGAKVGTIYPYTYVDSNGLCKGFAIVKRDLNYDLITYERKDEVTCSEPWFGALYPAYGKNTVYTDLQTATNFKLDAFVESWYEEYMAPLTANYDNVDYLSKLMGLYSEHADKMDWILPKALTELKDPLSYPGIVNRVMNYFVEGTLLDSRRLRVPIVDAVARYLTCDPTAFDANGDFHPSRGVLKPGEIFVGSEITGNVSMVRSPNAEGEKHHARAVYPEALAKMEGNALFYSCHDVKAAETMHEVLGGSDNDDRVVIYHGDADKHMRALPTLDLKDRVKVAASTPFSKAITDAGFDLNDFPAEAMALINNPRFETFNVRTFEVLRNKMGYTGGIGSAVNKLWLGAIIKHNLPNFLDVIAKRDGNEAANKAKAALPDFWGKDLELVIDTMINSGSSDEMKALVDEIESIEVWISDYKVIPDLAVGSGVHKGRVSSEITGRATGDNADITIVETALGKVARKITQGVNALRMKYGALMLAGNWSMEPLNVDIPAYIKDHVSDMRSTWAAFWEDMDRDLMTDDEWNGLYKSACSAVNNLLHELETEDEKYLAVAELYRRIYVRELSDDDTKLIMLGIKRYPDGLLFSCDTDNLPGIGSYTIDMLALAGEGRVVKESVHWDAGCEYLRKEVLTCTVSNRILRHNHKVVGLVMGIPNGTYTVQHGKVVVEGQFNKLVKCKGKQAYTLVDGWYNHIKAGRRTEAHLQLWKDKLVGNEVELRPMKFKDKPAVGVFLNNVQQAWVASTEVHLIKRAIKVVVEEARSKFVLFAK